MTAEKTLSNKGKEKLFNCIKEFIDAEIDIRTLPVRPSLNQEQVEERAYKAGTNLINMIMELDIQLK